MNDDHATRQCKVEGDASSSCNDARSCAHESQSGWACWQAAIAIAGREAGAAGSDHRIAGGYHWQWNANTAPSHGALTSSAKVTVLAPAGRHRLNRRASRNTLNREGLAGRSQKAEATAGQSRPGGARQVRISRWMSTRMGHRRMDGGRHRDARGAWGAG